MENYFRALADASRIRIINLLLRGELCGCDIQRVLDTSQPNVSRHLNYLKHAGMVSDRRDGPRVYYRLIQPAPVALETLFGCLNNIFATEESLRQDLQRLDAAIRDGSCGSFTPSKESDPCQMPLS